MGTTLLAAMRRNVPSFGIDRLPVATFVAKTLPILFSADPRRIRDTFEALKSRVSEAEPAEVALDVRIMKVAFPEETLLTLRRWKSAIDQLFSPMQDVFRLLFLSILEPCSYTAKDGQFLRLKRNKRVGNPDQLLEEKARQAQEDGAARLLKEYRWPGNVRELANAMERAVILATDRGGITRETLSFLKTPAGAGAGSVGFHLPSEGISLEKLETSLVRQALEACNDNQTAAARLLGLTRAKFRILMKQANRDGS